VVVDKITGKITGKKIGQAKVTAKALNGKFYTFTINVVAKAKELSGFTLINPKKTMIIGNTSVLKVKVSSDKATNQTVTFKSSNTSLIKVDKAGKLYAVKKGTAKITVSVGGKKQYIKISVK
jgi:alpha-amylase